MKRASKLTEEQRAVILQQLLGSNVMHAMDALRAAAHRYARWPQNAKRQKILFDRLEDVMCEQVNRVYGVCGAMIAGLDERITADDARITSDESRLSDLEERTLDVREAGNDS